MLLQNNLQLLKQGASCLLRKQTDKYGALNSATKVYTDRQTKYKNDKPINQLATNQTS